MILTKKDILPLTLIQSHLSTNFELIQDQFKKIIQQINSLKYNSFNIIDKLNQIDPYDQIQYQQSNQLLQQEDLNNFGNNSDINHYQTNHQSGDNSDHIQEKSIESGNDQQKNGNTIQNDSRDENNVILVNQKMSQNTNNSLMKKAFETRGPFRKHQQTDQHLSKQVTKNHQIGKRYVKKHLPQNPNNSQTPNKHLHQQQHKQFPDLIPRKIVPQQSILKQFIKNLQMRVQILEQQKQKHKNKIQNIQKDNQIFKKILQFKQSKKRSSRQSLRSSPFDKIIGISQLTKNQFFQSQKKSKFFQSQNHLIQQQPIVQNKVQKQQPQLSQILQQTSLILTFNSQLQQLKQHLHTQILLIQTNLKQNKQQITYLQSQNTQNRKNIQNLQQKCKQNQLNVIAISDAQKKNSKIKTQQNQTRTSLFVNNNNNIKKTQNSQRNLNDTVQSYITYYQDKIIQIFEQMDKLRNEYYTITQKLTKQNKIQNQQKLTLLANKLNHIKNPFQQQFTKQLTILKKQHNKLLSQFTSFVGTINQGTSQTKTLIIKPNQNKQDWKNINQQFYKFKQTIISSIKDIQSKIITNNSIPTMITELQCSISQCKTLANKKLNTTDFDKTIKRLQTRLNNFIKQIYQKQLTFQNQNASIVKQPWFCLSCDTQIKNYQGHINKSINHQQSIGKKVNPESHMIRRSSPGGHLPPVF